jgi:competence protein ComEC
MFLSNRLLLIPASLFLILTLAGCAPSARINRLTQVGSSPNLRVNFFDVGQGDAVLVITPAGKTILVDGGPGDAILSKLGKTLPLGQKKIDTVVLTHPHTDHLEGLIPVLRRYAVGEVYYSGALHTTDEFLEWLSLVKDKNIPMRLVKKSEVVELDSGVKLSFLYPDGDLTAGFIPPQSPGVEDNLTNTSIVFKLIYGQTSFLLVGDVETPVEEYLLKKLGAGDLRADVLKTGHHGSHSSTSEEFLNAVKPRFAVISAGRGNDYGHPHLRTLRRLERHNVKILRTDTMGDIKLVSDGSKIRE